jgi:cytidylate kinase
MIKELSWMVEIGTVVFPNAELKIFMTASATIRAKKRYDELIERECGYF